MDIENRLSDSSVKSVFDGGYKGLKWQRSERSSAFFSGLDFRAILDSTNPRKIIHSLPSLPLYFSVKRQGIEDSLEVLALLSPSQLIRIFDYDTWSNDRIDLQKSYKWLSAFKEIGTAHLYNRFEQLEEDYKIAMLAGRIRVFEKEEVESNFALEDSNLIKMPCGKVFVQILVQDKAQSALIEELLSSLIDHNMERAYSLIYNAAYSPPGESEDLLRQFRNARLEEEGFLTYEESQHFFLPLDLLEILKKYDGIKEHPVRVQGAIACDRKARTSYLEAVLALALREKLDIEEQFNIHQRILYVSNGLCAAAKVEPHDLDGLDSILQQTKALMGLGLDFLSHGDVKVGLEILRKEHPKTLFRTALTLIAHIRQEILTKLEGFCPADRLRMFYQRHKFGNLIWELDTKFVQHLGFEAIEVLKGLFNRFPMRPVTYEDQEETAKIKFVPINSMACFQELTANIEAISVLIFLANYVKNTPDVKSYNEVDLERLLLTATARVFIGDSFYCRVLNQDELAKFASLELDRVESISSKLLEQLRELLKEHRSAWSIGGEYTKSLRSIDIALNLFKEMIERLVLAKGSFSSINPLIYTSSNCVKTGSINRDDN